MATPVQSVRRLRCEVSRFGLGTITVRVGRNNQTKDFVVHEDLIRAQSSFFNAAMRNEWVEAQERVIRLPEDDAASFTIYQHWIYSRTICSKAETAGKENSKEWDLLVSSYILGEKLQDPDFKDAVVDAFLDKYSLTKSLPYRLTATVYNATPKDSLARQLMVDIHVWDAPEDWLVEANKCCYNLDSLFDIAAAFVKHRVKKSGSGMAPYKKDRCLYHEHTQSGTPCYKTKS